MEEKDKSRYLGDVEYFSAKLEQDPSSFLYIPLAKAYLKLEKFDEAVQTLTAGLDNTEEVVSAKTMLARAYLGLGKIDDAKAILTEVMVIDKSNYLASKLMGDIQRQEDDLKKALISYRSALMIAPEDQELKNLVEELMSAAGIAAHELDEEFSLMDADDEMLDKLGSELAEEVRQEVGEAELGTEEASADEVGKTIDDIVGGKAMADDDDDDSMSLDNYEEDGEFGDELEEELVASLDDSIIPTDLSTESEPSVLLDKEIMEADEGEAPSEDDVQALAAELGADLGLELGAEPEDKPAGKPDEVDEALSEVFDKENEVDGMSFFEGVSDEPVDIDKEKLLDELTLADSPAEETPADDVAAAMAELEAEESGEVDEVAAAMAELEGEQTTEGEETEESMNFFEGVSDEPVDIDKEKLLDELTLADDPVEETPADDVAAAMAELEAEESGEVDEVAAAMAELEQEQSEAPEEEQIVDEAVEEDEEVAQAQNFDELQDMLDGAEAVTEEGDKEPEKESEAEEIDDVAAAMAELEAEQPEEASEEIDDVSAAMAELNAEQAEEQTEESEEIFEASMDELLEEGPSETENAEKEELEKLPPETREQVNRLENLLEIIKNNSAS